LVASQPNIGQEVIVKRLQSGDGGLPTPFLEELVKDLPQKDQHG
jgi:hypothetical protein